MNPIAGQSFTVFFEAENDLSGATVKIKYQVNGGSVISVDPTSITGNTIKLELKPEQTQNSGEYSFRCIITHSPTDVEINVNKMVVVFDKLF